jgi:hypothetical protein
MTTLTIPSLERRLLHTVGEEVAAEPVGRWPEQRLGLCLAVLREVREYTARGHRALEKLLGEGVEARSFARDAGPALAITEDNLAKVRGLLGLLSPGDEAAAAGLAAELRLLEQELGAFHDLLAEAVSRSSEAPRPVDWAHVRAAEEAHARGETKPFSRR